MKRLVPMLIVACILTLALAQRGSADTIGTTAVGGSVTNAPGDYKWGNRYALPYDGTVSKLSAYLADNTSVSGGQKFRAAIYADQNGSPGARKALSATVTVPDGKSPGWVDFPVSVSLTAGNYWLVLHGGLPRQGARRYGSSAAGVERWNADVLSDGTRDPFGTPSTGSWRWSMAATYAAAKPDRTPPSTPTGLTVTGTTETSVSVSWNASTDNVAVTGYGVYRNGTRLTDVIPRSYTFTGLACGTTYTLGVDARDAAGNRSGQVTTSAATATCTMSEPGPIAGQGYHLAWSDEFTSLSYSNTGTINDAATWQRPYNGANDPGTVTQSGGSLFLTYTPATATKSVLIGTRKSADNYTNSWTYGYFEVRSKQPYAIGTYGQIWLFSLFHVWGRDCQAIPPYTDTTGGKLLTSEIDIDEGGWGIKNGVGSWALDGNQQYNTSTHYNTSSPCGVPDTVQTHFVTPGNSWFSDFHTYAVKWTPTTCTYYTDGVQTYSVTTPASANQPMYILLGNTVHSASPGPFPPTFTHEIDWVRVWQQ